MRALYKSAPGPDTSRLENRPIPPITPTDNVRVNVLACAVCGMDVHILHGKFDCTPPFVMGHEFVGIVETVGPGVTSVQPGDRVVAQPHLYTCGTCPLCQNGFSQYCAHKQTLGIHRDGAMAEYVSLPAAALHKIPRSIPDALACLVEPMTILVDDVIDYPKLQPGETVVIIGAGQIAQLAVVAAKSAGARVFVSGTPNSAALRLPAALKLGADAVSGGGEEEVLARVMDMTGGQGADLVVETSGSEAGIRTGIRLLRVGGRMSVMGLTRRDTVSIPWDVCLKKMIDLQFHMMSNYTAMDRAADIFAHYPHDLSPLVTHIEPLENWQFVFDELTDGKGIKGVLTL